MQGDLEFKRDFLLQIEERFPKMTEDYKILFSNEAMGADDYEVKFKKDIYDFTREQFMEMFKGFRSSSLMALTKRKSLLLKYSGYAIEKRMGIFKTINLLEITKKDLKECVSENKQFKRNMTRKELYSKIPLLLNESDKLLFILYFKGIFGIENSEIVNLKPNDFDLSDGTLFLNDKVYQFNSYEQQVIKNAINETEYQSYATLSRTNKYAESPFLFKNFTNSGIRHNIDPEGRAKHVLIQRRVLNAVRFIGEELWSPNTIYRSGIASKILAEHDYEVLKSQDILRWKLKHSLTFDHVGMMETMDVIRQKIQEETEN